jgi:hypothetical protein
METFVTSKTFLGKTGSEWIRSGIVTFLTFFLASLALGLKDIEFSSLETAGGLGAGSILLRAIIEAGYIGFRALVVWLAGQVTMAEEKTDTK